MAKPKSNAQMRLDSAHVYDDAEGIPEDDWCRLFFEHVYCAFDDADFADMYETLGRPPISPSQLASITILQSMQKVSDREAIKATIRWRDWRIALGISPDYKGFDPTVLVRFRQRLLRNGRERELFQTVLGQIEQLGLLKKRRKLRVDATSLIANVAYLSRGDVIAEAIRVVVASLAKRYPKLLRRGPLYRLHRKYGEEIWVGLGGSGEQRLRRLGRDGFAVLELCEEREVSGRATLEQILEEHFILDEGDDEPKVRPEKELDKDRIVTPHEPDVRVGTKRNKSWIGDKVHIVETADKGRTNFITDVLVTGPRVDDSRMIEPIVERVRSGPIEGATLLADGGYSSAGNTKVAAAEGIDLVSPPRPDTSNVKVPASEFEFDFEREVARCPEGHTSSYWRQAERVIVIRFATATCRSCPRWAECTNKKQGRSLSISKDYEQLALDRARAKTPEFAELYKARSGVEGTFSELVHRCGLRRSRYRGAAKRELHAVLCATGLNVVRLLRCLASGDGQDEGPFAFFWWLLRGCRPAAMAC